MSTSNAQPIEQAPTSAGDHLFAGFDGWIELFRAGRQVDSAGREREWTAEELDQIVANHSAASAAPHVIGHPRTDAPAYGWIAELKREGDLLLGRSEQVMPEFAEAVSEGRYRRRSVAIGHDAERGFYLRHVGWLGAAPPAIKGLKDVEFNDAAAEVYEFGWREAMHMGVLARLFRGLRELLVERFGVEAADRAVPGYEVDDLAREAGQLAEQADQEAQAAPAASFSEHEEAAVADEKTFTEADVERAKQEAREAARQEYESQNAQFRERVAELEAAGRRQEAEREVAALIDAGKVTPAQAAGLTEFVASLDGEASFEFAAGDEQKSANAREYFLRTFMANQPKVVPVGPRRDEGEPLAADDYPALRAKAQEFQEAQRKAGHEITFTEAWEHVKKEASQ